MLEKTISYDSSIQAGQIHVAVSKTSEQQSEMVFILRVQMISYLVSSYGEQD